MEFNYWKALPAEFDESSRVWIYQSNRLFTLQEALQIDDVLNLFTASWNSHGIPVKGFAKLFFGHFIVLMADEQKSQVSGCSTDSSVHMIREIEKLFAVGLFDRQLLAFYIRDKVHLLPLAQLASGFAQGVIHQDSLYFNNNILTKKELENNWIIPVNQSWLASRIPMSGPVGG
jgi:hypothetical protein